MIYSVISLAPTSLPLRMFKYNSSLITNDDMESYKNYMKKKMRNLEEPFLWVTLPEKTLFSFFTYIQSWGATAFHRTLNGVSLSSGQLKNLLKIYAFQQETSFLYLVIYLPFAHTVLEDFRLLTIPSDIYSLTSNTMFCPLVDNMCIPLM